jgi:hypothetical protein
VAFSGFFQPKNSMGDKLNAGHLASPSPFSVSDLHHGLEGSLSFSTFLLYPSKAFSPANK